VTTVRRSFTLDTERDAELLAWLDAQANVSEAVRKALRAYHAQREGKEQATLADVVAAIEELGERMAGLQVVKASDNSSPAEDEDPELAAALDNLGL
jgi:Arc/MetJ-type ribon-helix-helix transcriptional regulator